MEELDRAKPSSKKKAPLKPGGLMKAVVRPGSDEHPKQGDQVIFHFTTRTEEGVVVESTKKDFGGSGKPIRLVLGKSKVIRGWEEGLPTVPKGEIAMLKVLPELHYGDPECPVPSREGFPKDQVLVFEIEMLEVRPVKAITEDLGVLKQVLREGQGFETAREPYEVQIWVTARAHGEIFFSSSGETPLQFTFGKKQVPEGLEKAIGTMTKSERSIIYLTGNYIVPAPCIPDVPIDVEEIEFEIEVARIIQVRDMLGDGRLVKRRLRDGVGEFPVDCPLQDSVLRIHYKGLLPDHDGRIFYDTRIDNKDGEPFVFPSGEGLVPEGLEMCIKLMLPGELALVTSTSEYAYDKFPRPAGVPEKANVQWEVELLSFETIKDWTGFNFREIMDDANKTRTTGNRLFKEGKIELAKAKYEKILREFKHVNTQDEEEGREFSQARILLELNVAACEHKLGNFSKCIDLANKVLELNPAHSKALYRRGTAYMSRGDFEEARADFLKMLEVDKSSEEDAKAALAKLRKREQEAEAKARRQFGGLFDKKPGEISQEAHLPEQEKAEQPPALAGTAPREAAGTGAEDSDEDKEEVGGPLRRLWNAAKTILRAKKCVIL